MKDNVYVLCRLLGGSNLYNLATPESDKDERGLFMHTDPKYILGTGKYEEERQQNPTEKIDIVYKELNAWISLLKRGNTEALELLFAPLSSFSEVSSVFQSFRQESLSFLDSERLFTCLSGYGQSEYRLAIGERTGVLGSKRKEALDKYGFSPKNATQLLRLLWTGIHFFEYNRYVVDTIEFGSSIRSYLYDVKTKPETYSKDKLTEDFHGLDEKMKKVFDSRSINHRFNEDKANALLLQAYLPFLTR